MLRKRGGHAYDAAGLLAIANGEGQCTAWADLFMETLAAQGITSTIEFVDPSQPYTRFCVNPVPAQGSGGNVYKVGAYQTGSPNDGFPFHALVLYVGGTAASPNYTLYDPSYGTAPVGGANWAAAELAYQNQAINWLYDSAVSNALGIIHAIAHITSLYKYCTCALEG